MTRKTVFGAPDLRDVSFADLRVSLGKGWRDLRRAPQFGLVISGIYVLGGWFIYWLTIHSGNVLWLVLSVIGFPLIGPFAAVGLYEVSHRLEAGLPLRWGDVLGVVIHQSRRQLPSICAIVVIVFMLWFFIGHFIFALFMGLSRMTNISSSYDVFLTSTGLQMLAVGTVVGAGFALLLYMITVLALPILLEREVDFVTAMITSFSYVLAHPTVMLAWGVLIAVLTFAALAPYFLGLLVVLPLLGHASWHLYRLLEVEEDSPPDAG